MIRFRKRFLSLALAGLLALPTMALAKGSIYEEPYIKLEPTPITSQFNVEAFEHYFDEPSFFAFDQFSPFYEYAYVDDNGNIEKWIAGGAGEIDGLHWTAKNRKIEKYNPETYEDNVEEPHAHLYISSYDQALYPIHCEEADPTIDGIIYTKFPAVRFLSEEKCQLLLHAGLTRAVDNYEYIEVSYGNIAGEFNTLALMTPIYIDEKNVVCSFNYYDASNFSYPDVKNKLILNSLLAIDDATRETMQKEYPAISMKILPTTPLQLAAPSFMLEKK